MRDERLPEATEEQELDVRYCMYHPQSVFCMPGNLCKSCGWNPAVDRERKQLLRTFGRYALLSERDREHPERRELPKRTTQQYRPSGRPKRTWDEILTIVRLSHKDFGIGTQTKADIKKEYRLTEDSVVRARKQIKEEIAMAMQQKEEACKQNAAM